MNNFIKMEGKEYNLSTKRYCQNASCRASIINDFDIMVENHFNLPIGCSLYSSIQGGKAIKDDVIVLKAVQNSTHKYLNFIFPSKMGKELLKTWEKEIPPKMTVYKEDDRKAYYYEYPNYDLANLALRILIEYLHALHVFRHRLYIPLPEIIINIYNKLYECPSLEVNPSDIYYLNDYLRQELANCEDLFCDNLTDFALYMQKKNQALPYKEADFTPLRAIMYKYYGPIKLYF